MTTRTKVFDGSTMPFGKYLGVPIDELPDGYLYWILNAMKFSVSDMPLQKTLQEELDDRIQCGIYNGPTITEKDELKGITPRMVELLQKMLHQPGGVKAIGSAQGMALRGLRSRGLAADDSRGYTWITVKGNMWLQLWKERQATS